jgi:hypothetical protein
VSSGPIVKVYKWDEDRAKLQNLNDITEFKNQNKEIINPENMILINGENTLVFTDSNDTNTLYDFDLGTGKIV